MYARIGDARRRSLSRIGVAIYAAFLVFAAFEHHDLLCQPNSPQHCTACTSSQLSTDARTPALLDAFQLVDAGRALVFQLLSDGVLLAARTTGRSPPFAR